MWHQSTYNTLQIETNTKQTVIKHRISLVAYMATTTVVVEVSLSLKRRQQGHVRLGQRALFPGTLYATTQPPNGGTGGIGFVR